MIRPDYTKQVLANLAKIEAAERAGNNKLAAALTRQLLSYFYMYIRELEIKIIEEEKTS